MEAKEIDSVFSDAEEKRELSPSAALTMIAKSMAHVADPKTSDDEAKDAMIRCYSFTKSAAEALEGDGDDPIRLEKSLVDAVEDDGKDARVEPVSRAVDAIRKRFVSDDKPEDEEPKDDDKPEETDINKSDDEASDDQDVRWQHDLNTDSEADDDWGKDPDF
jgi:hypothetical protein